MGVVERRAWVIGARDQKKKKAEEQEKDFLVITGFYGMQMHKIIKQDACTAECMDM